MPDEPRGVGKPVGLGRRRDPAEPHPDRLQEPVDEAVEVAAHRDPQSGDPRGEVRPARRECPGDVAGERGRELERSAEDRGEHQVEPVGGGHAGELDQEGGDDVAEVVVVDRRAGEPGVRRRHRRRRERRIDEGEVHELLEAVDVVVEPPHQQVRGERNGERRFRAQETGGRFLERRVRRERIAGIPRGPGEGERRHGDGGRRANDGRVEHGPCVCERPDRRGERDDEPPAPRRVHERRAGRPASAQRRPGGRRQRG